MTAADDLIERVKRLLGGDVLDSHSQCGDATVIVPLAGARECLRRLKLDPELAFNVLIDLTAVDHLGREPRFELVYHLASIDAVPREDRTASVHRRLRVKTAVPESPCAADSACEVWSAANWSITGTRTWIDAMSHQMACSKPNSYWWASISCTKAPSRATNALSK